MAHPGGRPRKHDRAALMAQCYQRMALGHLVCEINKDLGLSPGQLYVWALEQEFAKDYARAREAQAHALAEHALHIGDGDEVTEKEIAALEVMEEEMRAEAKDGKLSDAQKALINSLHSNVVQRDRMRLDARKWYTSKIAPRLYGDRMEHKHSGSDDPNAKPIRHAIWKVGDQEIEF